MAKPIPPPKAAPDTSLRAVKVLEEKIANLDRKIELIEDNILKVNKKQNIDIKAMGAKMNEMEKDISLIKKRVVEMAADLKNFARREQVQTLQKYVDYWEPVNFVTRHEVEDLLRK